MINVKNLVKCYNNNPPAVNNVSFEIEKGEIVGLLGPNGAGKTTIMRILTCYLNPTEGEILIDGKNTLDDPIYIKKMVGYLPEHTPQYEEMTVYEYLKFIADIRGIAKGEIHSAIKKMVDLTSIETVISRKINQLSNGFRKRVGLASVMIHDPQILILDEPTAGLDPNQIITFRKILRRLSQEKTIILSTHVLSEIEATCERVIIIKNGQIAADDTIQNLVNKSKDDQFVDFIVKAENLLEVENQIVAIEGAWKIEFEKKLGPKEFKFKALISKDSPFEDNLKSKAKELNWEIINTERNNANLEEIFLKLTSEEVERA
ncbi:MAG: ATP-binding cassette domain-containing protein [Spirochaetes bacterium]|nr:ATP-binding cassette domain-containing protein [Spirochaetota bacterium]